MIHELSLGPFSLIYDLISAFRFFARPFLSNSIALIAFEPGSIWADDSVEDVGQGERWRWEGDGWW